MYMHYLKLGPTGGGGRSLCS